MPSAQLRSAVCQVGVWTNNQSGRARSRGAGAIGVGHRPLRSKAFRQFNGAPVWLGNGSVWKPSRRHGVTGCNGSSDPGSLRSLWQVLGTDPEVRDATEDEDHRARHQPSRRRGRPQALLPAAHRVAGSVEGICTVFSAHGRQSLPDELRGLLTSQPDLGQFVKNCTGALASQVVCKAASG
jgi:hypothetical protein